MTDLHDLQARAGEFDRATSETDDPHSNLLSGLENGLSQLRERLVGSTAVNDRLARENAELRSIAEQLLGRLETKPADTLHDQLSALDGQLHGLLELSGDQTAANRAPVAAVEDRSLEGVEGGEAEASSPFEDIRVRMRALSDQLLAPIAGSALCSAMTQLAPGSAPDTAPDTARESALDSAPRPAPDSARESALDSAPRPAPRPATDSAWESALDSAPRPAPRPAPSSILVSDLGAPPKPPLERRARRDRGSPRAFDRPIRALAEKAQNVLPKARLRFDAETDYALSILRRLKGGRQPFSVEEVRELINGKFGLTLTDRHDAQLSASVANQDGVTRGPRGNASTPSWRFEMG